MKTKTEAEVNLPDGTVYKDPCIGKISASVMERIIKDAFSYLNAYERHQLSLLLKEGFES